MLDFIDVLVHSAESGKYPLNNWLEPNGKGCDRKSMYGSMFRHAAESYCGVTADRDSGLRPRQHAICRLVMDDVRSLKGLKHPADPSEYIDDLADWFDEQDKAGWTGYDDKAN
jgi:hypothetical protein